METRARETSDLGLVSKYETAFFVFMAVLAYLWRENPEILYPQVLYCFLLLMGLNLAAGLCLRRFSAGSWLCVLLTLSNCGVVTAILSYSGGARSNLWVLYLLPIYTTCLLLGAREVAWITAGAIGFNAAFLAREAVVWNAALAFELMLKGGLFVFSAMATHRIARRDRAARERLRAEMEEIRKLTETVQGQQDRLRQAEGMAELGLSSAGLAHDLNNAFMSLLGLVDLLRARSLETEVRDALDHARRLTLLAQGILSNFVSFSRERRLELSPCDLHEMLDSVLSLAAGERGRVEIRREFAPALPRARGNRAYLQRLFLNLVTNAFRAMAGCGTLTLRTELALVRPDCEELRVTVEDTGPGLPEAVLARLFKPFSTTRQKEGGTGLGLFVCHEIAQQHGGRLRAENRREGGARFTLCLPAPEPSLPLEPSASSGAAAV